MTTITTPIPDAITQEDKPSPSGRVSRFGFWRRWRDFLYSRRISPVPMLITFSLLPVLFGLGTWQLLRMEEKNALLAEIRQYLAHPPADLRSSWPQQDARRTDMAWSDLHYRPLILKGEWLETRRFKLAPRIFEGQAGYQLIVPLRLEDDQIVLVNRGFVPSDDEVLPQNDANGAKVTLAGIGRVMETEKPFLGLDNDPKQNRWVWADIAAMGRETGFSRVAPILIYESRDTARDTYPIGGQVPLPQSNRHWHYAVTWYAMALILIGVYIMSLSPKHPQPLTDDKNQTMTMAEDLSDPVARRTRYPEATD